MLLLMYLFSLFKKKQIPKVRIHRTIQVSAFLMKSNNSNNKKKTQTKQQLSNAFLCALYGNVHHFFGKFFLLEKNLV